MTQNDPIGSSGKNRISSGTMLAIGIGVMLVGVVAYLAGTQNWSGSLWVERQRTRGEGALVICGGIGLVIAAAALFRINPRLMVATVLVAVLAAAALFQASR
ncbi:MAG: hypothetical protein B7Z14_10835 [Bosea sp. 32-68-6]|nr:MAG: hypothetical protein B7Z14_10835 [Bosea sp. 32-68-6]